MYFLNGSKIQKFNDICIRRCRIWMIGRMFEIFEKQFPDFFRETREIGFRIFKFSSSLEVEKFGPFLL